MKHRIAALLTTLLALAVPDFAWAAVQVFIGPTPIVNGAARANTDITVFNGKLAFAIAVGTAVPYGVPRGAIVDVAPVSNGRIGRDHVVFADFIPNDWSAWPNTYHRVEILEQSAQRAVIRATRDWGQATVTTLYTLQDDSDAIEIRTTLHNEGSEPLSDLLSGLTLWPNSGYLFSVPGLADQRNGKAEGALSDRVLAYDADWNIALHAPYFDHIDSGSMDMLRLHTLAPGASQIFEGWLQVGSSGDLGAVVQAEINRRHLASGTLHGRISARSGKAVDQPVVVIEKQGKPYAWVLGHKDRYQLTLPVGDYLLHATGKGYSQSRDVPVSVRAGSSEQLDFLELSLPGRLHFSVHAAGHGRPLDARITIVKGQKPLPQFLGRQTFFTEFDRQGELDVSLAPGEYLFKVSAGGGFLAPDRELAVQVASSHTLALEVAITPQFNPRTRGWYSADTHHHADQAEAVTPPMDLARSQLAAGLDLLFVSDHDSTVNHRPLQQLADRRAVPFIPSMELSASWGHFNAYPLRPGQPLQIDTGTASIDQLFAEARRQGARVVQANHPYNPYGYFSSLARGEVPGGFNPQFELIEINASEPENHDKVLHAAWALWNERHHYYLSAGTDTHDVWMDESGRVRLFAHLTGKPSAMAYAEAVSAGHAYVSFGPLLYPSVMFGSELKLRSGEHFNLGFDLESVSGLKQARLIARGGSVSTTSFTDQPHTAHWDIPLIASGAGWYELIVEDRLGGKAYSDPIWVDVLDAP